MSAYAGAYKARRALKCALQANFAYMGERRAPMQAESELSLISVRGVTRHQLWLVVRSRKGQHRTRVSNTASLAPPVGSALQANFANMGERRAPMQAESDHILHGSSDARPHARKHARTLQHAHLRAD